MNERKQSIWRKYNFSDGELIERCDSLISMVMSDIVELSKVGVDINDARSLGRLCQSFKDMRSDNELAGDHGVTVENKDVARDRLLSAISSVMSGVSKTYDSKSAQYRRFGTKRMQDKKDADLLLIGRRVHRICGSMEGMMPHVTGQLVEKLRQAHVEFERMLHLVADKVSDRDIATEERITLGNNIYEGMMALANFGKLAFAGKSPAKYDFYVQYESNAEAKRLRKERQTNQEQ